MSDEKSLLYMEEPKDGTNKDRVEAICLRTHAIMQEIKRLNSSVEIAMVFGVIVRSFTKTLTPEHRAEFERTVNVASAVFDAVNKMSRGVSVDEAAALVKKEVAS